MHLVEEEISRKKSTLPWNFPQFSLTIEYSTQIIEPHTNSHCRHNFPQQFTRTIYRTQEESNFIHTNFLSIFFLVCWFCGWYWNVTPTHKIPHLSHRTTIWNYFRGSISMMMLNNQRIEHIDAHTHRTRTKSIHSSTTLSLYMEQKTSISIQLGGKVIPFHWILVNVNHHRILSYLRLLMLSVIEIGDLKNPTQKNRISETTLTTTAATTQKNGLCYCTWRKTGRTERHRKFPSEHQQQNNRTSPKSEKKTNTNTDHK